MWRHLIHGDVAAGRGIPHIPEALGHHLEPLLEFENFTVLARHRIVEALVKFILESQLCLEFRNAGFQGGERFRTHAPSSGTTSAGISVGGCQSSTRLPSGSTNQPK